MTDKVLHYVPPDKVYDLVPYITKYVKPAYDTGSGEMRWETLVGRIFQGDVQFWLAFMDGKVIGAATTEIIPFDGYKCIHIITSGTDNGCGFQDYHYALEDFARQVGAKNVQFWGRKGWSRHIDKVNGQFGEKYKEVYRVFSMEIDNVANTTNDESVDASPEQLGDSS